MNIADIPLKIPAAWASSAAAGDIDVIPLTTGVPGRASWRIGFPPLNFLPVPSGGIPPFGQDENGVLNAMSAWLLWAEAGGPIQYDSAFSTQISGYPKGAFLQGAQLGQWWLSLVDNNTSDPDTGGANWLLYGPTAAPLYEATGTANALIVATSPVTSTLTDGLTLAIVVLANNTTAATLDAGPGAKIIKRNNGGDLLVGDLKAEQNILVIYDLEDDVWRLVASVPSQLAGAGIIPDGLGGLTLDIVGLPFTSAPSLSALIPFQLGGTLGSTTAGDIAGLSVISDPVLAELMFYGGG